MPEEVGDAILGHALEGQRGTYGKGHSLVTKARWIAKVPVEEV